MAAPPALRSIDVMFGKPSLHAVVLYLVTGATAVVAGEPAARWTLVHSEPGRSYYVDEGSVSTEGNHLTYWVLVDFDYGMAFDGARPYKSARLLQHARCASRAQDTKSVFQYDAPLGQGELRWASTVEDDVLRLEPVEPGSVASRLLELVCAMGR